MKKLSLVLPLILLFAVGTVRADDVYTVTSAGPLTSFSVNLNIVDNDSVPIQSITFDLSGTHSAFNSADPLTFDSSSGIFSVVNGTGGSYTLSTLGSPQNFGGTLEYNAWELTFTNFGLGNSFSFNWDPDCCGNNSYGTTVGEQAGMLITIGTMNGNVSGTLEPDSAGNLSVVIPSATTAPEPSAMMLLASALILLAVFGRKFVRSGFAA